MNDRKQHVITMAHQLFIEKGFQATSIQDILDYSGISKGTFYNYFASKNELLIALIKTLLIEVEKNRDELLIGQDPSNIEVFSKQLELQFKVNRRNKLLSLFEEVISLNDADLNKFIRRGHFQYLHWLYVRFLDLFGESKKPYLLDCAIMFMGILHQNIKYREMELKSHANIHEIVSYSVKRLVKMVEDVSESGDQLVSPELLEKWRPAYSNDEIDAQKKINKTILILKKRLTHKSDQSRYFELLDFIQEELLHSREPRTYLIESTLAALKKRSDLFDQNELEKLEQLAKIL
jgi:AcrR family transcriptional regulator